MRREKFVFHDAHGVRWKRFKLASVLATIGGVLAAGLFVQAILDSPTFQSPNSLQNLKKQIRAYERQLVKTTGSDSDKVLSKLRAESAARPRILTKSPQPPGIRAAFLTGWDAASFRSLADHQSLLTHICPEWLTFTNPEKGIAEDEDAEITRMPSGPKLMPVLSNLDGDRREPEGIEWLAQEGPAARSAFIESLASKLKKAGAAGVVLDWEEIDPGLSEELTRLVSEIADGLREKDLRTWVALTMDYGLGTYDLDRLSTHVDYFVALLHDENGENDPAGPLASQDWFEGWLEVLNHSAPPEKWIAALGSYGCDWEEGKPGGEQISFRDAMSRAGNAGVTTVATAAPTFNGSFSYFYEGKPHEVWFLDAASFQNQLRAVRDYGFAGVAINRLGLEDPGLWTVLDDDLAGRTALRPRATIPGGDAITSIGDGEIVSLDPTTGNGLRSFSRDADGMVSALYQTLPSYPTLFRTDPQDDRALAITFDDGPDPTWTPAILDILKARGVKATFFLVGTAAERNPDLVRRIVAEGHEIGNHSFTHPNLAETPPALIKVELNATQRLIESLTGRSTTLFRPPYNADSRPSDLAELLPIAIAQSMGYMTILENVDPRDWQQPSPAELIARFKEQRPRGNVLLLHDGGGDRSSTVTALPAILDYIAERGDHTVPVSELLGLDRDAVMPPLPPGTNPIQFFASGLGFLFLHMLQSFLHAFIVFATILVLLRTAFVLVLARLHKNPAPPPGREFAPPVTVLVPAYNEEKVIRKTLSSLLASHYAGEIEVLVLNDGSTDSTEENVRSFGDPRVRLITQQNAGKAHALQRGVNEASNEILIFVDADTQFDPEAIRELVSALHREEVGAVSGHARVGNLRTFLARCQDLEYVCGFNLDRRAYAAWNCITVAPGAISAIRKSAILKAGGFSFDTLAEDTDLTLAIHKAGYRIEYQPDAIAYTEAPETFATLAKQRFRWAFGTLQCVWKHRDMVFNPRYKALGWFSLPGIWFFQVILIAFSPFIDLLFLQSILFGNAWDILPYFLAFLLCDVVLAAAAVRIEGLPLREALRIIPQRFLYRPLLSYVIWKSLLHAIRGAWVGWGKLQRTASVSVP